MKKTLATLLVCATVACLAFGLAACGDKHTHTPGEWINTDPTGHYKLCTDSKCDNPTEKLESAAHDTNGTGGSCSVCGYAPEAASPEATLKTGFYSFEYNVSGMGAMKRAVRFYEDYLCLIMDGGGGTQCYLADYKLEKKNCDYAVWYTALEAGRGADGLTPVEKHTGTADYTITATDRTDSSKTYTFGYDGTYIYTEEIKSLPVNDMNYMRLIHDAEKDADYSTLESKNAKAIVQLYKEGDETSYFTILHDGTYSDLMDSMIEGTWTSAKAADGKVTYTLTPNDATDTGATVVVNADGKSGTYTPNGGAAINVAIPEEKTPALTLTGNTTIQPAGANDPMDAVLNLYIYEDSTCKLTLSVKGSATELDAGTFTVNKSYAYVFTFDSLGEITSSTPTLVGTTPVYSVVIPADSASGRAEATLSNGKISSEEIVYTLTGTHSAGNFPATLVLKDDDSATYTVEMPANYGGTISYDGTWTNEKVTFDLGQAGNLEITLTIANGAVTGANATQQITLTNVVYTLTGTHSAGNFPATLKLLNNEVAVYTVEMPANYGGTISYEGTWTNEKVTFDLGQAGNLEITLTIVNGAVTGANTTQQITLTNVVHTLTGTNSGFPATLQLLNNSVAVFTVEMPAQYGGTSTSIGIWTNEKATFDLGQAGKLEITLSTEGEVITGTNESPAISLTNQPAQEE